MEHHQQPHNIFLHAPEDYCPPRRSKKRCTPSLPTTTSDTGDYQEEGVHRRTRLMSTDSSSDIITSNTSPTTPPPRTGVG
jgi:hypothetical protein